jgi:uncharacterized protein (TIGR00251 family)
MDDPVRIVGDGVEVVVWVQPGARRSEIVGRHGDALRIRVAQPAEGGKANAAVASLLSGVLDAPVELRSGASSRRKRFFVKGGVMVEVRRRLDL